MTSLQKWIIVAGLAAIGLALLRSPYRYTIDDLAGNVQFVDPSASATAYAPAWSSPDARDLCTPVQKKWKDAGFQGFCQASGVELDSGKLVLWLSLVVVATAGAALLASKRAGP